MLMLESDGMADLMDCGVDLIPTEKTPPEIHGAVVHSLIKDSATNIGPRAIVAFESDANFGFGSFLDLDKLKTDAEAFPNCKCFSHDILF